MNERIKLPAQEWLGYDSERGDLHGYTFEQMREFAQLIVKECIGKIETYQIPVGNSAAGEMACEWTYDALKEIRDEIKEHFGVK
jgi:hypothetical protein